MRDELDSVPKDSTAGRKSDVGQAVTRRDFLNGVSIAVGASLVAKSPWVDAFGIPDSPFAPEKEPGYYPPGKDWECAAATTDL